jgi:hypothetical protein
VERPEITPRTNHPLEKSLLLRSPQKAAIQAALNLKVLKAKKEWLVLPDALHEKALEPSETAAHVALIPVAVAKLQVVNLGHRGVLPGKIAAIPDQSAAHLHALLRVERSLLKELRLIVEPNHQKAPHLSEAASLHPTAPHLSVE